MKIPLHNLLAYLSLSLLLLLAASCEKFEGEQEVPSYIRIDTIGLKDTDFYHGSLSAKITDAWVYVENQLIGGFELPATIPVLAKGEVDIIVRPGVMLNGMINTRAAYDFYDRIDLTAKIAEDSITTIGTDYAGKKILKTSYKESTYFAWQESFEDAELTLDTTAFSTVGITLTETGSPDTFEGLHSGLVVLKEDDDVFEAITSESYELPQNGSPIFLEMNYKNNSPFTVGLVIHEEGYSTVFHSLMVYNARTDWNKVYINLTQVVANAYGATSFQLFFGAGKSPEVEETRLLFDNFRLIYLQN